LELKDIKAIIDLMKKNDLSVFEMEKDGFKLKLEKGTGGQPVMIAPQSLPAIPLPAMLAPGAAPRPSPAEPSAPAPASPEAPLKEIVSPMVGTFYRSPSPEAGPYTEVGKEVTEESVVCIIEAMKVMNEIKAEVKGVIVEVMAETGKPVQFGQVLFRVK
jgi:acetyl-CoA carboxylase biotin carboxyl carrier protein